MKEPICTVPLEEMEVAHFQLLEICMMVEHQKEADDPFPSQGSRRQINMAHIHHGLVEGGTGLGVKDTLNPPSHHFPTHCISHLVAAARKVVVLQRHPDNGQRGLGSSSA